MDLAQPGSPSPEAVRAQLVRVLASRGFARAQRQREFLRHAVERLLEGKAESLKEVEIGMAVYGRGEDFDPRADNIVRVEARRLRQRLEEYYRTAEEGDAVLIEFPTGGYVPQISRRAAPAADKGRRFLPVVLAAVALPLAAAVFWFSRGETPVIAVLPFADYSPGNGEQYRAEGIAEDITQLLAETPRLRVVSRTSAFLFRTQKLDAGEIGRRLRANLLLEGSLQRSGERFRIAARLVSVEKGFPVWSGSEETDAAGLGTAARAIARDVAGALKRNAPGKRSPHVPPAEAQDLVLRARYLAGRGGPEGRGKAIQHYERAVALDPEFGQAWGELARMLSLMAFHDSEAAPQLAPRIHDAARRAIQIGEPAADPYFALARLAWSYEWDWKAAESGFRRALEINPNFAGAHQCYALALMSRRRFGEAVEHSRRAVELDPLSFAASNDVGVVLYGSRRFEEAAAHVRASLALAPESLLPHFLAGVVEAGRNRCAEAIPEFEKAAAGLGRPPVILGRLGNAYARAGRAAEARAVLAEMEQTDAARIWLAMVLTGLGERDRALQRLRESADRRETDFLFTAIEPAFDPLRRDPGFVALCGRLGLAPE